MKTFKAICASLVIALSLSLPAYADTTPGDGHSPGGCILEPGDGSTSATGDPTLVNSDISFLTPSDILWALASIY